MEEMVNLNMNIQPANNIIHPWKNKILPATESNRLFLVSTIPRHQGYVEIIRIRSQPAVQHYVIIVPCIPLLSDQWVPSNCAVFEPGHAFRQTTFKSKRKNLPQ